MRRSFGCAVALAFAFCLWLSGAAGADDKSGQPLTDQQFVRMASADNLAEIDLGRLALRQATSPDVKNFAQRLLDDHTKANKELNRIADAKRIPPAPEAADKKHRELMDRLTALRGADFDHEFMKHMVNDHKKAVALFEREAKEGHDRDLQDFASRTLPTLREHLKMARKIAGIEEKNEGRTRNP